MCVRGSLLTISPLTVHLSTGDRAGVRCAVYRVVHRSLAHRRGPLLGQLLLLVLPVAVAVGARLVQGSEGRPVAGPAAGGPGLGRGRAPRGGGGFGRGGVGGDVWVEGAVAAGVGRGGGLHGDRGLGGSSGTEGLICGEDTGGWVWGLRQLAWDVS